MLSLSVFSQVMSITRLRRLRLPGMVPAGPGVTGALSWLLSSWGSKCYPLLPLTRKDPVPQDAVCRICQESGCDGPPAESQGLESSQQPLQSFCACRGSLSLVHSRCLQRWRELQREDRCELCGSPYSIEKVLRLPIAQLMSSARNAVGSLPPSVDLALRRLQRGDRMFLQRCLAYGITVLLVWLWLLLTSKCEGQAAGMLQDMLSRCTTSNTLSGWCQSIVGATAIGAAVRLLVFAVGIFR
ncbi:unnamed protein product [Polarella glacialis]|nr:unnamed protein product [Polarella glacialis]